MDGMMGTVADPDIECLKFLSLRLRLDVVQGRQFVVKFFVA